MKNLVHRLQHWALDRPLFPSHMSFIIGPRQSGKTTMCLNFLKKQGQDVSQYYFNWDRLDTRRKFKDGIDWLSVLKNNSPHRPYIIFDEIHKVRQWKRLLKGIYDQYREDFHFIITGSGRLDHYQRGGDSLAGRYDPYFLLPFSPGEIRKATPIESLSLLSLLESHQLSEDLIKQWEVLGGFPEPFLSGSESKARFWWKQYQIRVTQEDLRDLTRLESVDLMQDILRILPQKIGSPLSYQSIREDVETSFATVKRYISTLGQLFITFEIAPFSKKIHRAITKEKKIYFYHHPAILDDGARFENMVAIILKRWIQEQVEKANGDFELCYLRDQDRREVDFIITLDQKPYFLFEVKRSDTNPSSSLRYYCEKLKIPGIQIVRQPGINIKKGDRLAVLSIHFLANALG